MTINRDFNKNDDVHIFKRKKGGHEWDWEDYGYFAIKDDKIDLMKFFEDEFTVYDDWDEYIEYHYGEYMLELAKNGDSYLIELAEQFVKLKKEYDKYKNPLIVIYDASGDTWIEDERYVEFYTDLDSYEWTVGVPEE